MQTYEEYFNTQEICFPVIPSHWSMWKIKHLFSERIEKGFPKEQLLVASQNHGVIPKQEYESRTVEATKDLHLLKLVKQGDFVISLRSFQGGIEYAHCQGIISPAYTIMIPKKEISSAYFRLLAKSFPFIEMLKQCVTGIREGQNIDYEKLKKRQIPLPPREEQDAIVRFLDAKCAKIDRLIKLKERQIALLNEKKQLIINQAVTRGLDPNVPMKDSGVDYIGMIPSHWQVILNHRLWEEKTRSYFAPETVLSLSQQDGVIPYEDMTERSLHTSSYENWKLVLPGDLVVNRFKAHLGVFFSSGYRGIVTFHYGVFKFKMEGSTKYYEYLYHTSESCRLYASLSNGMTVGLQNLSNSHFYSAYSIYPPAHEQKEIVEKVEAVNAVYKTRAIQL